MKRTARMMSGPDLPELEQRRQQRVREQARARKFASGVADLRVLMVELEWDVDDELVRLMDRLQRIADYMVADAPMPSPATSESLPPPPEEEEEDAQHDSSG